MSNKQDLKVGQRVKFHPTHNKSLMLTGSITAISETNDLVEIEAEPDGKVIEVAVNFSAQAADVTPLAEPVKVDDKPHNRLHRAS